MELGLADEQDYPHHGLVDYQDPAVDPGTGTIRMRGVFPNRDGAILPGFFVRVRIPAGRTEESLLVPERALGSDKSGWFLLVVGRDDLVEPRRVDVGARVDHLRVVTGKISQQDRVVTDGLLQARPGLKVVPVEQPEGAKAVTVAGEPARQ
jgi:membrane fusion protein (multidrug efflux system)